MANQFQLRYCPTLAKKPVAKQPDAAPKRHFDPFENPAPELHIADIPTANPTHLLVLNKFPIIAEHFILATKPNKKQTHVLEQDDLEVTYACLKAWQEAPAGGSKRQRLFAFFNSGDHSGASQPHRHLQFLPIENMHASEATKSWHLLLDLILRDGKRHDASSQILQHSDLPFEHFACTFPSDLPCERLHEMYTGLFNASKTSVEKWIAANPNKLSLHKTEDGDLPISYNLAMTTNGMVILPRRSEGSGLHGDDGTELGFVALNGTTLGGTMMVKHKEEWDALRHRPGLLDQVLNAIGIPRASLQAKSHV